ncbi:hypothetical protein M3P05_12480 [Sansalvadorimonas sp. 2012CJ34-2]|uniref:Uncharacterized protein n=1 Tax=Parendozoicomonas callyspongiae TaxID=2942213 RepID=A0ABT0PH85_9GAMM|nr:hypothetical protein [Sansalvadorimonas sp. 2012CJ34-2]MCL6270740.1 hypothetical protein [Sansalvadorimonas sp. 2012CJ34-2]
MNFKLKSILTILAILIPMWSHASQSWHGPFTIKKVQRYWDGGNRTTVTVNEKMKVGCKKTDSDSIVTVPSSFNSSAYHTTIYSGALAAQAQGIQVRLFLDSYCDPKYGRSLWGIEIISE